MDPGQGAAHALWGAQAEPSPSDWQHSPGKQLKMLVHVFRHTPPAPQRVPLQQSAVVLQAAPSLAQAAVSGSAQ